MDPLPYDIANTEVDENDLGDIEDLLEDLTYVYDSDNETYIESEDFDYDYGRQAFENLVERGRYIIPFDSDLDVNDDNQDIDYSSDSSQ